MSGSEEDVGAFYRLHVRTRRRHGLPPQPFSFFRNIHRHVIKPGLGFVALAHSASRPIAGAVFFSLGRNAIYKFGASDERYQDSRPNNLVIWHAIQKLAAARAETLHLGRTSLRNEGLRRFKLGWGTIERPLEYFRFDVTSNCWTPAKDNASGIHNALFKRLPLIAESADWRSCLSSFGLGSAVTPHLHLLSANVSVKNNSAVSSLKRPGHLLRALQAQVEDHSDFIARHRSSRGHHPSIPRRLRIRGKAAGALCRGYAAPSIRFESRPAPNDNLISSEVEILTSWDLAMQVASTIGPERLLPNAQDGADLTRAAEAIRKGLSVSSVRGTNIISASYRNADPKLATLVLKELVSRYFTKHLDVHRSADAFNFVSQQSDQVRARLNQTEEELKRLKAEAGIVSLSESTALINVELSNTQSALQATRAEYAEQKARVAEIEKSAEAQAKSATSTEPSSVDPDIAARHQALIRQLDGSRRAQMDLLAKYSEKAAQPELPNEFQRARQVRKDPRGLENTDERVSASDRAPHLGFLGTEREKALALARERYRRQNDTGFGYQAGKKDFDTLVKEAQDEILGKRIATVLTDKSAELELVKINQMQVDNLDQQLRDLERRYPELVSTSASPEPSRLNLDSERARLAGIEARAAALKVHSEELAKTCRAAREGRPRHRAIAANP